MRFNPDRNVYTLEGQFRYDIPLGEIHELADGVLTRSIEVRAGLEDRIVLNAVIFELTKRGYTVLSPDGVRVDTSRSQDSQGT